jgi:hypothetical protein
MISGRAISFASTILLGSFCSILIGIGFFGLQIFNIQHPGFQFVSFAAICSLFYSMLKYFQIRNAIYVYILIAFLYDILLNFSKIDFAIRDAFFLLCSGLAICLFFQFFEPKLAKLKFDKFLTFSSLFVLAYITATLILALIFSDTHFMQQLFTNISLGLLIGMGLGIGFELANNVDVFWSRRIKSMQFDLCVIHSTRQLHQPLN